MSYRRRLISVGGGRKSMTDPIIDKGDDFADVVIANEMGEIYFIPNALFKRPDDYSEDSYLRTPEMFQVIGLTVIPSRYKAGGKTTIEATNMLSCSSPDWGGAPYKMYIGPVDTSKCLNCIIGTNNSSSPKYNAISDYGSIPTDYTTATGPVSYVNSKLRYMGSAANRMIPSPILYNGDLNPEYFTKTLIANNALADMDGKEKTAYYLDKVSVDYDWKTSSTITNYNGTGHYPLFMCSWRYHTVGTNQGDWYIPTPGEAGFVLTCMQKLDDTLTVLRDDMHGFGVMPPYLNYTKEGVGEITTCIPRDRSNWWKCRPWYGIYFAGVSYGEHGRAFCEVDAEPIPANMLRDIVWYE